jgi:pimeloyl-ACP methyl ester carboxylesterase
MSRLWWHRTRRVALVGIGVLLALAMTGAVYQAVSVRRERTLFAAPGLLVDIGGRRLHLLCLGEGTPTVVFEAPGFGNALSSSKAREGVAAHTRVCSYDRMGTGWSDPGPSVITAAALADDLDRLLTRVHIEPPYLLVASSIGGLTAEMYARKHQEHIAGLVLLDAATSSLLEKRLDDVTWTRTQMACLVPLAARLGLLRLVDPFDFHRDGRVESRAVALMYRPEPMATLCGLIRGAAATAAEFRTSPALAPDLPLAVLSAASNDGLLPPGLAFRWLNVPDRYAADRYASHEALARQSTRGRWQVVPGSTHLIASSHPEVVSGAVVEMISALRRQHGYPAGGS